MALRWCIGVSKSGLSPSRDPSSSRLGAAGEPGRPSTPLVQRGDGGGWGNKQWPPGRTRLLTCSRGRPEQAQQRQQQRRPHHPGFLRVAAGAEPPPGFAGPPPGLGTATQESPGLHPRSSGAWVWSGSSARVCGPGWEGRGCPARRGCYPARRCSSAPARGDCQRTGCG